MAGDAFVCVCVSGCMCVCVCGTVIYATFATFVISLALFFRIFPTFSCCFFARMCVRVCERGGGGRVPGAAVCLSALFY